MWQKCNQMQPNGEVKVCKLLKMVARNGYPQHSTVFSFPLNDVYLDPKLDLRSTAHVC
jgi:hypothetical protein